MSGDRTLPPTTIWEDEEYYSMADAARYTGFAAQTMRNKLKRLGIQQLKLPGSNMHLVKKSDLEYMLKPSPVE